MATYIGTEAAELLGVSLSRYYQLESRALQGMLAVMEPKKRGIQKTPEREIQGLRAEKSFWRRSFAAIRAYCGRPIAPWGWPGEGARRHP